jgi:hypothetical protein
MKSRVQLGRDVEVVRETPGGLELDGYVRLRPGFVIELVPASSGPAWRGGFAVVWSWKLRAMGRRGPIYRGECRWRRSAGHELPAPQAGYGPIAAL